MQVVVDQVPLGDILDVRTARRAFQVVVERDFVAADPFTRTDPCVVPAATLLSQLP